MTRHLTEEQLHGYNGRSLSTQEHIAVSKHLKECVECRERVNAGMTLPTMLPLDILLPEDETVPDHLTEAEIVDYVNSDLNRTERTILQEHLDTCSACNVRIQEFRDLQAIGLQSGRPSVRVAESGWFAGWKKPSWGWMAVPIAGLFIAMLIQMYTIKRENIRLHVTAEAKRKQNEEMAAQLKQMQQRLSTAQQTTPQDVGGKEISKDRQGNLHFRTDIVIAPEDKSLILAGIDAHTLAIPHDILKRLTLNSATLGSEGGDQKRLALVQPERTFLRTRSPRFIWRTVEQAEHYMLTVSKVPDPSSPTVPDRNLMRVDIEKQRDGWHVTVMGEQGDSPLMPPTVVPTGNEWRLPEALSAQFQPGASYLWAVAAFASSHPDVPRAQSKFAMFQILNADSSKKLAEAEARYKASPLLLGICYAKYGCIAEAEEQFQKVAAEAHGKALLEDLHQADTDLKR